MTVDTERRKKLRNRPRSLVYVELESGNGGMMRDLSVDGFALRAMMPLRAEEKTQFAFSLDEGTRISGEGRIVGVKEDGRVAGIEFCRISHSAREQICRWLDRTDQPTTREPKVPAIAVAEPPTREELREEARSSLSRAAQPSGEAVKAAPSPEAEIAPKVIPEPPRYEEPREEARSSLSRAAQPSEEAVKAASSPVAEIAPKVIPEPPRYEEPREERRASLSRAAQPSEEAVKAATSPEAEIAAIFIPGPPRLGGPREETRYALPRVVLPSVEGAETSLSSEPDVVPIAVPQPAGITDLAEAPQKSATAPHPETQTELHDISPESDRVAVLVPLPTESLIEPLPELQPENEFSETVAEHSANRSLLMRAIDMMLLLTLIVGAVVFHREVGHAFIWLGQIIAGPEETPRPQSSITEPPAQITPVPETTVPVGSPAVSDSSAAASAEGHRAASSETQPSATSKVIEVPPILPAAPFSSGKTPSAPVLQSTSQQNRVSAPGSSSGTANDTGQQEYQQAEQILRYRSSEGELTVAARLLWVAVEKGNVDAEVALAELYRQGQGVVKNCDQARVLLSAAARKGSADAQKHLEEFMREGCQ
jgi:hypothetical protein